MTSAPNALKKFDHRGSFAKIFDLLVFCDCVAEALDKKLENFQGFRVVEVMHLQLKNLASLAFLHKIRQRQQKRCRTLTTCIKQSTGELQLKDHIRIKKNYLGTN